MTVFQNCYEDDRRADAYATLEFARTYWIAFRDLPSILRTHALGKGALDFGCGTGRSTRFLRNCGFEPIGIDISPQMIARARAADPGGDYRLIDGTDFGELASQRFDVILSAFTFDNVPDKLPLFRRLAAALAPDGVFVNLVSTPEIYTHEWASFSTKNFPENRVKRSGEIVRIITTDYADARPVEDILFRDDAYRDVFARTGLAVEAVYKPLATGDEPWAWVNETRIAPWIIYVLRHDVATRPDRDSH